MSLVWVTGSPGAGKSTVCQALRRRGERAVDADWDGYNHWVDRVSGRRVHDPPYPAPPGWLTRHAWHIDRHAVIELASTAATKNVYLCGSVENEVEAWDLFDLVVCLVVDDDTVRDRLASRTENSFGRHPEELAAALQWNPGNETLYRSRGATIVSGTQPVEAVTDAVLAAAAAIR